MGANSYNYITVSYLHDDISRKNVECKNSHWISYFYFRDTTSLAKGFNIHDCTFENSGTMYLLEGRNIIFKNNKIWGCGYGSGSIQLYGCLGGNEDISGNYFDNCAAAIAFGNGSYFNILKNCIFGSEVANTADVVFSQVNCYDTGLESPIGNITVTNENGLAAGSSFFITNKDNTINNDIVYKPEGTIQRTGDGLSDTTVHTSGSGKFAMRFMPVSSEDVLEWKQIVPTGNLQNKTIVISVWIKINSVNYYSGTHQLPRLYVNYDNGTTTYIEASETTDWQVITVTFTPTTTYNQIIVYINGNTDQSSSSAYFYIDDMSVFYPPGVQLDLGGLDLWAKALPITPTISTNITAADVLNIQTSLLTTSGSIGKLLVDNIDAPISGATAPTVEQIRTELDTNSTKLANMDQALSTTESNIRGGSETLETLATAIDNIQVDNAAIADAVWDEIRSGHVASGTYGATDEWASQINTSDIADAVLDEVVGDHSIAGSLGDVLNNILKTQKNKWSRNGSTFYIYDDDNNTILYQFTLTDANGDPVTDSTIAFTRTPV